MDSAQAYAPSAAEKRRRADARAILRAGLAAVDARVLSRRAVDLLPRTRGREVRGRLIVLAAGKAAAAMTEGLLEGLPDRGSDLQVLGVVAHPAGSPPLGGDVPLEAVPAGHPFPDAGSEAAGRRMLELAHDATRADRVVLLLSGGASSLMTVPVAGLTVGDLRSTAAALSRAGAPIAELNAVRKHLSAVAGGLLGVAAAPAELDVLAISDVVGDDLSIIGSGPAYGDESTYDACLDIMTRRGLLDQVPQGVAAHLRKGARGALPETPRPEDPRLGGVRHHVLAGTLHACRAMAAAAGGQGYHSLVLSHLLEGEARELGVFHAGLGAAAARAGVPVEPPCALVTGGESTVTVQGPGLGGRNQETCLAAVPRLSGLPVTFLSAGTDGVDGPTEAAGGLVDGGSAARAARVGLDIDAALAANDSYTALAALGDLLVTGPTGTNVADVRLLLVGERT